MIITLSKFIVFQLKEFDVPRLWHHQAMRARRLNKTQSLRFKVCTASQRALILEWSEVQQIWEDSGFTAEVLSFHQQLQAVMWNLNCAGTCATGHPSEPQSDLIASQLLNNPGPRNHLSSVCLICHVEENDLQSENKAGNQCLIKLLTDRMLLADTASTTPGCQSYAICKNMIFTRTCQQLKPSPVRHSC